MKEPPFLLRIYAFLVFPWSAEGSLVWWWRMHRNVHDAMCGEPGCPWRAT
jgi:Leu/Phe-tRNA-protein transferase